MNRLILILGVCMLTALVSCQENEFERPSILSLSEIRDLADHENISITGTTWRLFGYGEGNRIRIAEPRDTDYLYWLRFSEDGSFEGRSSGNLLAGTYLYSQNKQIEVLEFFVQTYAGETAEGSYFTNRLQIAKMGILTPKGLKIHYEEENIAKFMLFRPL